MTCRHSPGDPNCSSSPAGAARNAARAAEGAREESDRKHKKRIAELEAQLPRTPDAENFEIQEAEEVGPHLVLKVAYPNCKQCSYEGVKVMVYMNTGVKAVLKWRRIDPHFREPSLYQNDPNRQRYAPGPDARFPGSPEGWDDAMAYALAHVPRVAQGKS